MVGAFVLAFADENLCQNKIRPGNIVEKDEMGGKSSKWGGGRRILASIYSWIMKKASFRGEKFKIYWEGDLDMNILK